MKISLLVLTTLFFVQPLFAEDAVMDDVPKTEADCERLTVAEKIKYECNLDAKYYGNTALLDAVKRGNKKDVKALILKGADIDIKNSYDVTALMAAVAGGNVDIFNMLIAAGANINLKNNVGNTALKIAQITGQIDMEIVLLSRDEDKNICDWPNGVVSQYFFLSQNMSSRYPNDKKLEAFKNKLQTYSVEKNYNEQCVPPEVDSEDDSDSSGGSK
jgi:hypothetical protein